MLCNACGKEIGSEAGLCAECKARGPNASLLQSVQARVDRRGFRNRSFKALIFVGCLAAIGLCVFLGVKNPPKKAITRGFSPSVKSQYSTLSVSNEDPAEIAKDPALDLLIAESEREQE